MICIGGTNDGVGRSGHPFDTQWIRVFCFERGVDGEIVQTETGDKRAEPLCSGLYYRASHPQLSSFWRHESLDTDEKIAQAVATYLARPPKPSAFDQMRGERQPPRVH